MENVFDDYFGHATEVEFLDWAVGQFREQAGIHVTDREAISYLFEVIDGSTGCGCDQFDWLEARVEIRYNGFFIIYTGQYSGEYGEQLFLDRAIFSRMGKE